MAAKSKINWYERYAMEHAITGKDGKGMYCMVVSERIENLSYRVDIDESTMQATRCQCPATKPCKHMIYANEVLASNEIKINEIEAGRWYTVNGDSQIWWDEEMQQWFAVGLTENALDIVKEYIEKKQAVKEAVTETEESPETVDETPAQEEVALECEKEQAVAAAPKVVEIAEKLDIPAEEVKKIAAIAVEYKTFVAPKHTNVCLPIGPRDTKKDMMKATLNRQGFNLLKV